MNILLIAYYFKPANVIGSKRWTEFYNLSRNDDSISFTVLTANWEGKKSNTKNIHYLGEVQTFSPKPSFQKENNLKKLRHPTFFFRSIDRSSFSKWVNNCKAWVDKNPNQKYDIVISSYNPLSCISIGQYAKKKYKIPFVLDLRDLISIQGQKIQLPIINFIDRYIDKVITKSVDSFITVSPTCKVKAEDFYKKKTFLIFNGYDRLNVSKTYESCQSKKDINILYTGTLGPNRSPLKILELLNTFNRSSNNKSITVNFASKDDPNDFLKSIKLEHLKVEWLGYLDPKQLIEQKNKTDILLLLEDQSAKGNENLTGKLFEYIESGKPVLVSCHVDSDIGVVLKDINIGRIVNDMESLYDFMQMDFEPNSVNREKYSRENQYLKLKECISYLINK